MIDIENTVITRVEAALAVSFPSISVYGEQIETSASFPCATVVELDNSEDMNYVTFDGLENSANLMYQIDVYSNLVSGAKIECKQMLSLVDTAMRGLYFIRTEKRQNDNIDRSVSRMTVRYTKIQT
jgi:hypothetical protein